MSNAGSVTSGVEQDGTRHINFRFGRPTKTNKRGVARLRKSLTPINTHIIRAEGSMTQATSGAAKWTTFAAGVPGDIIDILTKATLPAEVNAGAGGNFKVLTEQPSGAFAYTTQIQDQINRIASFLSTGGINEGYDGRFMLYSHDTLLEMKNQLTTACNLVIYEAVPRENVFVGGSYMNSSIDHIVQHGYERKNSYGGTGIGDGGNMLAAQEDSTLYMNPVFCHYFKIQKVKGITLKAGETAKIHMTHGSTKVVNPLVLGDDPTYLALRGLSRFLIVKQIGTLVSNGTGVDTSSTSLDYSFVKKFRWNALGVNTEMVTQTTDAPKEWALANQHAVQPNEGVAAAISEAL